MRVGFYYSYTVPGSERHLHIARHLIESVRDVMPGVEIIQLTDDKSDAAPGVDDVLRVVGDMPMGVRRVTAQSRCSGDWLFVDSDVVIQKDVRDVFKWAFDVAVTDRKGTEMEGTPYEKAMPYNNGVVFSRSPSFWGDVRSTLLTLPERLQEWEGEQRVLCRVADSGGFNVKVLPGLAYNYPPRKPGEDVSHASILHFKGETRKAWLKVAA